MDIFVTDRGIFLRQKLIRLRNSLRLKFDLTKNIFLLMILFGCGQLSSDENVAIIGQEVSTAIEANREDLSEIQFQHKAMREQTPILGKDLEDLAAQLNQIAIERSSFLQEMQAARAEYRARQFDRYPQVRPSASSPVVGGGDASIGLSVEQLIWDGGRIRAGLSEVDLRIAEARLRALREINLKVHDGLGAFVRTSQLTEQIDVLVGLQSELISIKSLLETRLAGGVADRGEVLRISISIQEIERDLVLKASELRQAESELIRLLPDTQLGTDILDLAATEAHCRRVRPENEALADSMARLSVARAEASQLGLKSRTFPRVILSGGSSYTESRQWTSAIGIRLDASDMLGLGRRDNIEATQASTRAAQRSFTLQKEETTAELLQLENEYEGLQSDETFLLTLVDINDDTLSLYTEQLEAGSISISDGVIIQRERANTVMELINTRSNLILNCLKFAELFGLLATLGPVDVTD